jgi:hypothetical protein
MDCERIAREEVIEKYFRGQLEPALERDLQLHLLKCPECLALFETCEDARTGLAARAPAIAEISEEQLRSAQRTWFRRVPAWRTAAVAAALSFVVVVALVSLRTWVIPGRRQPGKPGVVSNPGVPKPDGSTGQAGFPEIAALPATEQASVWKAIHTSSLSYPADLAELRSKPGAVLGDEAKPGSQFQVLQPVGEVVSEQTPVFQWKPLPGAAYYSVTVFDLDSNRIQAGLSLHTLDWKPARPLDRGKVYQWQVKAVMSNGKFVIAPKFPAPLARFRVLDQEKASALEQFRRAHPDAHLVLGVLYAQAGLLTSAEQELAAIPGNSSDFELAHNLLASIRSMR